MYICIVSLLAKYTELIASMVANIMWHQGNREERALMPSMGSIGNSLTITKMATEVPLGG